MEIKIFVKYLSFMEITIFVFSVESFWFLEFHEKEAKSDKRNFTRGVTVSFEVKIHKITGKIGFIFCKLTFFRGKCPSYIQICLNTNKIPKFH